MVKRKACLYMADMKKTGGGPIKAKPLTDLENDLLQTIGPVVVGGITGIAEASGLQVRNCFNFFFSFLHVDFILFM